MSADLAVLRVAVQSGVLRPLDRHFARWMAELGGSDDPALALAAALVSRQVGEGDVCLDLGAYAGRPVFAVPGGPAPTRAPALGDWRSALRMSAVVGSPTDPGPLVLDGHDRLYLGRYWRFEQDLVAALSARSGRLVGGVDRGLLAAGLGRLFPPTGEPPDWQRVAAALAVLAPLCVISGGPGTGKTRTVTAMLALLIEQARGRALRIALAAPTGKAAARLSESARRARAELPLAPEVAAAIPVEASTLHRLLGFRPGRATPRHNPENPLHADVLVVDEASMIDLPLMARLLAALPDQSRLILLGDKDQLASVEAGMVLGDICGQGRPLRYSAGLCDALAETAGVRLAPVRAPPVADQLAVLRRSYRFGPQSGIGAAARAVNAGDADAALEALDGRHPDAVRMALGASDLRGFLRDWLVPRFTACLSAGTPSVVLAGLGGFRILCAVREGPFGVVAVNRLCEAVLAEAGLIAPGAAAHYPGRPILVTSNDYALGLFNGDVGICLPDPTAGGASRAWFETEEGPRRVLPSRLPTHESVFAMTVHKSQGSEHEELVLVLPEAESRVVTRELVYTGLTRARRRVTLIASAPSLERAVRQRVRRSSGLYDALWGVGEGTSP
ncbi:MAG: exodeoxyribonuclease V subunit alpha [Chromatiaceae bacterium]|jgi:exodeoxyribonuclease V alpha subunit|nr:exodeoxyribonuclease V subunit alpha [Chromatiaceae bacterium]